MKRLAFLLFFILLLFAVQAELRVDSFTARPFDISARTQERLDRNGNPCALVKVELPVEGCKFEGNVIHSHYDVNEYWVYLSAGTKMFNIKCPGELNLMVNFSRISDIEALEGGMTYVLRTSGFSTGGSNGLVDPGASYLIIEIEPKSAVAIVKVDGTTQPVENGQVMVFLPYGQHEYIVDAVGYGSVSGTADVKRGENTTVSVALKSTKASLSVASETPGATIKINGRVSGTGTWEGELSPGTYSIEASKEGYKPQTVAVTLSENESRRVTIPALTAVYGGLNIGYRPVGAEVYIDGEKAGTTPYLTNELMIGRHTVRISGTGYTDYNGSVDITEGQMTNLNGSLSRTETTSDVPSASAPVPGARTQAKNLDLCAMRDGRPYFFDEAEWKALPASEQAKYDKKGVVVIGNSEEFILSLNCSERRMTWNEAIQQYGEDQLPREAQIRVMADKSEDISKAIKAFGGMIPTNGDWYWGKSKDSSNAWLIDLFFGGVNGNEKSGSYRVRTVEPIYKPSESTSSTGSGARTQAKNLDLCAMRDGRPYFFNAAEWKVLPASEQAKYDKKGVVVIGNGEEFVLSLNCSEPMPWNEAVRKYGEDNLPSEAQCRAMGEQYKAINEAIKTFGGTVTGHENFYWGKTVNSSIAWYVSMNNGYVSDSGYKTNTCRIRAVAPVPRS